MSENTQQLMLPPVRTFASGPPIGEQPMIKQYSTLEIQDIVERMGELGFRKGAIVCRVVNGEPQTTVYQRGMVTWIHTIQHHEREYLPIEVRWLGTEGKIESCWPNELFLVMPAISEDDLAARVRQWRELNK